MVAQIALKLLLPSLTNISLDETNYIIIILYAVTDDSVVLVLFPS